MLKTRTKIAGPGFQKKIGRSKNWLYFLGSYYV